jgi:hypothetical protein
LRVVPLPFFHAAFGTRHIALFLPVLAATLLEPSSAFGA